MAESAIAVVEARAPGGVPRGLHRLLPGRGAARPRPHADLRAGPRPVRDPFDAAIDRHFSTCPTNLYPEPSGEPRPGQLRAGPHTDLGSFTILAVNDAPGGLQVLFPDGTWRDVRPARGYFVVNLGDMMGRYDRVLDLERVPDVAALAGGAGL